ncbi:SYLC [Hepatospora eriocheir]|uniref:SYLC n=1 Tax=Hepatospora eriocheir TaxID=1081669 RepID=A0A1X0QJ46_9MICR|nr:SYLC [Hepatospora eriocheir]
MTEDKHNTSKLDYLNSVEIHRSVETNVDETREKFFITFPYPYMNGKLHLGHLYSFSKADIFAHFKELQGYNVLFPFAFHCTGMPISASAQKLKEEIRGNKVDLSIIEILKSLGFSLECCDQCKYLEVLVGNMSNNSSENVKNFMLLCPGCGIKDATYEKNKPIYKFTDPYHWCRTFPKYCKESLIGFDSMIDWRRSFITTEINPYYDAFVKYQFKKLKSLDVIKFGKKHSIFCPIDNQPCLDHDRRIGEGIKPIFLECFKLKKNNVILLIPNKNKYITKNVTKNYQIVISENTYVVKTMIDKQLYLMEDYIYNNLKYQLDEIGEPLECYLKDYFDNIKVIENVKTSFIKITSDNNEEEKLINIDINSVEPTLKLLENKHFIGLYIPEGYVKSRAGGDCVVSLVDQWFINYNDETWKDKVYECMKNIECTEDTKSKLIDSIDWIKEWACSRTFGLGTKIPWDKEYLIDSLSDSTIYMAFYTFKHYLFSDLEGKDELFPKKLVCESIYRFIFNEIDESQLKNDLIAKNKSNIDLDQPIEILKKCKESFNYFYPVDLRVSGKDLISNHLIFFIMNHVLLFDKDKIPKRIFTNGHLLLNGKKMSKSEGNFLTVENALIKYGSSSCRMCLADCGDTNEDANFVENIADLFVLKLYRLTKIIESIEVSDKDNNEVNVSESTDNNEVDVSELILINRIYLNSIETLKSYESINFKDVIKYGFYENLSAIENYEIMSNKINHQLINYSYRTLIQLMYPVIPSLSRYLLQLMNCSVELPRMFLSDNYITIDMNIEWKYIDIYNYLRSIISRIKPGNKYCIEPGEDYCEWKKAGMELVNKFKDSEDFKTVILKEIRESTDKNIKGNKKIMMFCMDYYNFPSKYERTFNEMKILKTFKDYLSKISGSFIEIGDFNKTSEPLKPSIILRK